MRRKILIVEDDADLLSIITLRIEAAGYQVLCAGSAEKAMGILKNTMPDLILLDLILPKMQGEVFCKQLKTTPAYKDIPVIIVTAKSILIPEVIRALEVDDCITKPFEASVLLKKIAHLIG